MKEKSSFLNGVVEMKQKLFALPFIFFLLLKVVFGAEDITGFWKSLDDDGQDQCVFGIYEYQGLYYGRIIGTYDKDGKMTDTIYNPTKRSAGVIGNPYTCGLDIVYNLEDNGSSYDGKILDPSKGKEYNCELWREDPNLIVRGKLFIFGRNISWYPTTKDDFPENFKLPDMTKFVPVIPKI